MFNDSYLPHSTTDLGSLCHSVRTVGNCTVSMEWVIPFCQRFTQMLWGKKNKKPLFTAYGLSLGLAEVGKQLQTHRANPLMWPAWKDRGLSTWHRLAPQPALVTQTRLQWTNAWERAWRSPSRRAQLPSVPCATRHACCGRESLACYLASIQIP